MLGRTEGGVGGLTGAEGMGGGIPHKVADHCNLPLPGQMFLPLKQHLPNQILPRRTRARERRLKEKGLLSGVGFLAGVKVASHSGAGAVDLVAVEGCLCPTRLGFALKMERLMKLLPQNPLNDIEGAKSFSHGADMIFKIRCFDAKLRRTVI